MNARPRARHAPARPRLAFVGLGWIGRTRLDAVARHAGVEVAALHDVDRAKLAAAAAAHAPAAAIATFEEVLDAGVDGVVIATPNGCHAAQALAALERGLPVFCQKPLATSAADARAIVAAAERAGVRLGVDFCYRHVAGLEEVRRRIAGGELGEILAIDLTFHNAYGPDKAWCRDPVLAGGGCLLDLGVHLVDLATWLQGGVALRVVDSARYAEGRALPAGDRTIEDLAFATFRQPNGATVRLACSWHAQSGCDAIIGARVVGTRGGAVWRNVGGSFYDFEVDLVRHTYSERLGGGAQDWGSAALLDWIEHLHEGFDPSADAYVTVADAIDGLYAR